MVDHTIEVHFSAKSGMMCDQRKARLDARVIELLTEAIAPTGHGRSVAEAIYRAVAAMPGAMARAVKEVDGG